MADAGCIGANGNPDSRMNPIDATTKQNLLDDALAQLGLLIKWYDANGWHKVYRLAGDTALVGTDEAQRLVWRYGRDRNRELDLTTVGQEEGIQQILAVSREPTSLGAAIHSETDLVPFLNSYVWLHLWDGTMTEGLLEHSIILNGQLALARDNQSMSMDWRRIASVERPSAR